MWQFFFDVGKVSFLCLHSRDAYQDQEEDQALSGLAAAVTLKSRGVTYTVFIIYLQLQYVHLLSY